MGAEIDTARVQQGVASVKAKIANLVASLGERYTLEIRLPDAEAHKLAWFDGGTSSQPARPTMGIGDAERSAAAAAVAGRVTMDPSGRLNVLVALTAAGNAVRLVYVGRLRAGGGDRQWAALSPAYAARKQRLGQPTVPGVATGATDSALQGALVVVRRT